MSDNMTGAANSCEAILHEEFSFNREHAMLHGENLVTLRLLDRRLELIEAYAEVSDKLSPHRHALRTFLQAMITTSAFWSPQQIAETRDDRARLKQVNQDIAAMAAKLGALVAKRKRLSNDSGFYSNTHNHVAKVIEASGRNHHYFKTWVREPLANLRTQFELKYWPDLEAFLMELARDAEQADLEASDPVTAAATRGPRKALSDYFEALAAAIEDRTYGNGGFIPSGFILSDSSLAAFANCALDLTPDAMVDAAYVKRWRQRRRERSRPKSRSAA